MSLIARRFDWAINDIFIYSKVEILAQKYQRFASFNFSPRLIGLVSDVKKHSLLE